MKRYWLVLSTALFSLGVGVVVVLWSHNEQAQLGRVVHASNDTYGKKLIAAKRALDARIAKEAAEKKAAEEAALAKKQAEEAKKAEEAAKAAAAARAAMVVAPPPVVAGSVAVAHRDSGAVDVLVNKKHPLVPLSFAPLLGTAQCSGGVTIAAVAAADLSALCDAASALGVPLGASSSYRSYATQVSTYNYWVKKDGQVAADTYSARPGYSEHQTGLALDFRVPGGPSLDAFTGTAQQQWLAAHAWHYGFIQRYTDVNSGETGYMGESWHYRYVGRATAADYVSRGISSLESYWSMPGGGY